MVTLTAIYVGVKGQRDIAFPFMLHIYSPSLLIYKLDKYRDDERDYRRSTEKCKGN